MCAECTEVHTDGGNGGDDLPQFQFVQDGCFPSSVQPHHQNPHLLLPNQTFQQVPENVPHGSSLPVPQHSTLSVGDAPRLVIGSQWGSDSSNGLDVWNKVAEKLEAQCCAPKQNASLPFITHTSAALSAGFHSSPGLVILLKCSRNLTNQIADISWTNRTYHHSMSKPPLNLQDYC